MSPEAIVFVPYDIARRAWECAYDMGDDLAQRDPEALTWRECAELLRLHRHARPRRV